MNRLLASLIAFTLVVGPASLGSVQALENRTEPECSPAEDGTEAYVCQLPEECQDEETDCPVPPECERVDESTFRCEPPEETTETTGTTASSGEHDLIRSEERPDGVGQAAVECALDEPNGTVVCQPTEACREDPACRPPSECEAGEDGLYRCDPRPGRGGPPGHAEDAGSKEHQASHDGDADRAEGDGVECRPAPDGEVMLCKPPAECREQIGETEACTPPPECEPREDGLFRCPAPDEVEGPREVEDRHGAKEPAPQPDCRSGPERGTVICEPPAECREQIGETEACTPPPECERRSDGTFLCQIPDRAEVEQRQDRRAPDEREAGEASGNGSLGGEEDPFQGRNQEKRAQARADIAESMREAAEEFRSQLDELETGYEAQLDDLRADYQDGKEQLRGEYDDCRAGIPDDASPSERSEELQACLDQARQGLDQLRQEMRAKHDELRQSVKQDIEDARQTACQKAENAALEAVGDHGIFDANPSQLMPDRALEMCPSFGNFGGGEAQ